MPFSTIDKGSKYFNTVTWTGDDVDGREITTGFATDWTWAKRRNSTNSHIISDSVRGATYKLDSSSSSAEVNNYDGGHLESFTSTGFTMGVGSVNFGHLNATGGTYVAWNWLAGGTASSNTSGTITSTVSANTTSGFSIVSYTGTGANATVGHGLGVVPKMIIWKNRSATASWQVYHHTIPQSSGEYQALQLNLTNASAPFGTYNFMNGTLPTSSVFSLDGVPEMNNSGNSIIAYCFAEVKGFSKFGSYTGNGSSDGTFVYTGFKPAFIMIKSSSSASGNWLIQNNKMQGFNKNNDELYANLSDSAYVGTDRTDLLSNGFKARINSGENNSSGVTYIYMSFAENPFVTSKGLPVTAR